MVDLPGYGYAKVSRGLADKWMVMIERYLDFSQALRVVFLLVDIRHDPSKLDVEAYHMLYEKGFNPLVIATKADKIKSGARNKHLLAIRQTLGLAEETPLIPFSSLNKEGRDEVWEYVDYFVREIQLEEENE